MISVAPESSIFTGVHPLAARLPLSSNTGRPPSFAPGTAGIAAAALSYALLTALGVAATPSAAALLLATESDSFTWP